MSVCRPARSQVSGCVFSGQRMSMNCSHHAADHLHDALFLIDAFEQLAAHAVDGLALLVHDVVVFEQVFAGFEVLRFDGFLGLGDALGDELAIRWAHPLPCPGAASDSACARRRRCAADRPAGRGRSGNCRGRPGGRRGRATGCRCAAIRAVRCRRCAGRRARPLHRAPSVGLRLCTCGPSIAVPVGACRNLVGDPDPCPACASSRAP